MIDSIKWHDIHQRFSQLVPNDTADLIFESLDVKEYMQDKKMEISADSLSIHYLKMNEFRLFNILIDVIKKSIGGRKWDLWTFELVDQSTDSKKKEKFIKTNNRYSQTALNQFFTFENYFSSNDNFLLTNTCHELIKNLNDPIKIANSFFIYGPSGYGKTHIVNAFGNEIFNTYDDLKILYATGNSFVQDYVDSFKSDSGNINSFYTKYRSVDILIIDDFQWMVEKENSLDTFFNIYDYMLTSGKLVVLCSDTPLERLVLPSRVTTRIKNGIMITMNKPDLDTRRQIFEHQCSKTLKEVTFDPKAVDLICQNFNNPRELIGFILNLSLFLVAYKTNKVTEGMAIDFINEVVKTSKLGKNDIIDIVCDYFDVAPKLVLKTGTRDKYKLAGDFIILFLSKKLQLNQKEIARLFNFKDHSSVSKRLSIIENTSTTEYRDDYIMLNKKISNDNVN